MTPYEAMVIYDLSREVASGIIPLALMPAIIGAVGSVAGAGISAMGAAKQGRDAKKMAREQMAYQSPAAIRDRALAGGFNPLTVLTNGGLQQQMPAPALPSLSSLDAIGQGIGGAARALASYDPIEKETRELENELLRTQIQNAKTKSEYIGGFGQKPLDIGPWAMPTVRSITRSPVEAGRPTLSAKVAPPMPAAAPRDDWTFPVRSVDGAIRYIPPSYARRLGLERYDTIMAGELAEIFGELAGEGAGLASAPVVADLFSGNVVRGEQPRSSAGYGGVLDAARYNPLTASTMWLFDYMGSGHETPSGKTNRKN